MGARRPIPARQTRAWSWVSSPCSRSTTSRTGRAISPVRASVRRWRRWSITATRTHFDMWRDAFGKDAGGRGKHGARRHRIFRSLGDEGRVTLDIDFDTPSDADAFLTVLRNDVWSSADKAPAKVGKPSAQIIDLVESQEYT